MWAAGVHGTGTNWKEKWLGLVHPQALLLQQVSKQLPGQKKTKQNKLPRPPWPQEFQFQAKLPKFTVYLVLDPTAAGAASPAGLCTFLGEIPKGKLPKAHSRSKKKKSPSFLHKTQLQTQRNLGNLGFLRRVLVQREALRHKKGFQQGKLCWSKVCVPHCSQRRVWSFSTA